MHFAVNTTVSVSASDPKVLSYRLCGVCYDVKDYFASKYLNLNTLGVRIGVWSTDSVTFLGAILQPKFN